MKKTLLLTAVLLYNLNAFSQFTFSASPGIQLNNANFGYKFKKFNPYLGIQFWNAKGEFTETGKEFNSNGNLVDYKNTYEAKMTLILPCIGLKYFFWNANKIQAYGNLNFSKLMMSGKIEDSQDPDNSVDEDLQEIIKNTSISAFQLGFGTEYFFDNNFSLGAEFGLNMLKMKSETSHEDIIFDPNTSDDVTVIHNYSAKGKFNPTYTKISLNFYFGKE